jgi:hypothetical protein
LLPHGLPFIGNIHRAGDKPARNNQRFSDARGEDVCNRKPGGKSTPRRRNFASDALAGADTLVTNRFFRVLPLD